MNLRSQARPHHPELVYSLHLLKDNGTNVYKYSFVMLNYFEYAIVPTKAISCAVPVWYIVRNVLFPYLMLH